MKIFSQLAMLGLAVLTLTGCGTVTCGSKQKVAVYSDPSNAEVTVFDIWGTPLVKKTTPCELTLARKSEDNENAKYRVLIEKPGYEATEVSLIGKVNRAYTVNFLTLGVGYAIDPLTGGMWTLAPDSIRADLQPIGDVSTETGAVTGEGMALSTQ